VTEKVEGRMEKGKKVYRAGENGREIRYKEQ